MLVPAYASQTNFTMLFLPFCSFLAAFFPGILLVSVQHIFLFLVFLSFVFAEFRALNDKIHHSPDAAIRLQEIVRKVHHLLKIDKKIKKFLYLFILESPTLDCYCVKSFIDKIFGFFVDVMGRTIAEQME